MVTNVGCDQAGGEGIGRKLCVLVGIEELGSTLDERLVQGIETEDAVQGVGKLLDEQIAAVPVDDSDHGHEATQQRHIGNTCATNGGSLPKKPIDSADWWPLV